VRFNFPPLTPLVRALLIGLAVAFVVEAIVDLIGVPVFELLALDLSYGDGISFALAWQIFTHWFVWPTEPRALIDVGLDLLMIYFFLCPFEKTFGPKQTVVLSAVGVLTGAFVAIGLAFVFPRPLPWSGASAIFAAAFGAFPVLFRDQKIMLFPLLIPMKAWHVILLGLGISALMAVLARDPHVFAVHAAALGSGGAYAKWLTRPRDPKPATRRKRRRSGPDLRVIEGGSDDDPPRWLN